MTSKLSNTSNHSTSDKTLIRYTLKNDYMFRAVFQSCPQALEDLCRSLLHLSPENELHVEIKNPIQLGQTPDSKEFILDLALTINNNIFLNLEMQVYNDGYWPERSLSYTCRSYDNLNRGAEYSQVLPILHVGFLNFTLFPQYPEFVANYQMMNINPKYRYSYSDKLRISVVDLTQIDRATEEDQKYGIDKWARLLTATTREEIDMLTEKHEVFTGTATIIYDFNEDRLIRQQCQAREDFLYWERIKAHHTKEVETELANTKSELADKNAELTAKNNELENRKAELAAKDAELAAKDARIAELLARLSEENN